jgi:hypothetical protein
VTVAGSAVSATLANFGVVIHSPDGMGCASGAPGGSPSSGDAIPYCNWYPLFWVANDRRLIEWLTADTPDFPASYVPGLVLRQGPGDPIAGTRFHFQAPAPAPSPFSMDDAGHPGPTQISVRGGYWQRTREGTVKLTFATDDITPGSAGGGLVRAQPGSEMARLMGSDQEPYVAFYAAQIGAEHWDHGSYRKQLLAPEPHTDSFSGSCSFQGTDYFSPPASNTPQQLGLTYRAGGSCTGTLDGHVVANAPVGLVAVGRPYGTCSQAGSLAPGSASITFAHGPTISLTFDFSAQGTEVYGIYYGQRWGYARAHATFATQRTGPGVVTACATGTASQVPMDLSLTTSTALVSAGTGGAPGATHGLVHRLRLVVRPRTVVSGRRVTFSFRVTSSGGRPIPGARVRLGSHTARSKFHGTAGITTTFHRPGAVAVRATKPGWRPASITIAIVRGGRAHAHARRPPFTR